MDKVKDRLEELKRLPAFEKINRLLLENERLRSVDFLFERYLNVKEKAGQAYMILR